VYVASDLETCWIEVDIVSCKLERMTDPDTRARADPGSTVGPPRWVKVFGAIALVMIVLFVVVLLIGGGEHGPGRHSPGTASSGVTHERQR